MRCMYIYIQQIQSKEQGKLKFAQSYDYCLSAVIMFDLPLSCQPSLCCYFQVAQTRVAASRSLNKTEM